MREEENEAQKWARGTKRRKKSKELRKKDVKKEVERQVRGGRREKDGRGGRRGKEERRRENKLRQIMAMDEIKERRKEERVTGDFLGVRGEKEN